LGHAVDRGYEVTLPNAALLGWRLGNHIGNERSFRALRVDGCRQIRSEILRAYSDAAPPHLAVLNNLLHDLARHADRHGKSNPDIAATRRQNRRVYANEFAPQVHQRSARITGIDRSIGLDEILVPLDSKPAPT
jgi:hypothetical protein